MDFPQTIELKARVQPLDTALFRYPFRVRVQGDKAVVMDLHGTDYFCHVFHYPGFRYFASFGKRGEAPEEMLSAENIRWHGQSLWGLDAGKSVLTKYDFTSEVPVSLYLIDYQLYMFYKIARVTNVQQKFEKLFPLYLTLL